MSAKLIIGCGYLGRRVAAQWRAAGERVFATTRRPERADEFRALGLDPIMCDITRPESLTALPHSVDAIVHCVGLDRTAGLPMRTVYVDGLRNILTTLLGWTGRFVHVSSTSVYGQTNAEDVDETAATEPIEESGRIVLDAERCLRMLRPEAIVLRFAGIYGPDRLLKSKALRAGEPLTAHPDKRLNLIHVDDGARAVVAAIERGSPGAIYNVCDDEPVLRRAFYARFAELIGAPPPTFAPSAHERANRRILNTRLRRDLAVELLYPTFKEGLRASV